MSLLLILQSAPYASSNAKEAIDIALTAGTFDQKVSILFTEDACYQLMANQQAQSIQQKNSAQMLKALPIYGINEILVDKESLEKRSIINLDTEFNIRQLSKVEIKSLYQHAKTVLRF